MAKEKDPNSEIDAPSAAYLNMSLCWELIHDLLGGSDAMRTAANKWLSQEPLEEDKSYKNRLARSFLYGAYRDTVAKIVSKPFSQPVEIIDNEKLPEPLGDMRYNIDKLGRNITQFAREVFEAGVIYGLTHILIDYPTSDGNVNTLADERETKTRPVFVHIKPTQLIGWQTRRDNAGNAVLTQIRISETRVEPAGLYGDQVVEYIRVYNAANWEIYRKADEKEFTLYQRGEHTFGAVPLVTFYTDRAGFLTGTPPLSDLADLNLAHWQSNSDQRNILRFARTAVLLATGFKEDELEGALAIGPNQVIKSGNENATLKYVEHSGAAIGAGQRDLERLEEQMEVLGLQPFMRRTGTTTATERNISESKTDCEVQAWIRELEGVLESAYEAAAKWVNAEIPEKFGIGITNDFGLTLRTQEDIAALIKMRQGNEISHETFLREIKRRGIFDETLNIEEEIDRLEREGPDLAAITAGAGND